MRTSAVLSGETFRFFRDLARNNRKEWMDANRERYREHVVAALHGLVEALTPGVAALDPGLATDGKAGSGLSRINRDTRFSRDKTPYHTRMYVRFSNAAERGEGAQFYVAVGPGDATAGFRVYGGLRDSILRTVARVRAVDNPDWLTTQARRLRRRYESYWYARVKGEWTKLDGFPTKPDEWARLQGWVVRRSFTRLAATRPAFPRDVTRVFRDLFPLYAFTSPAG